ncbi:hypothetical protein L218DRAFT_1078979 [Marasmius fiardii PR-910]|nr:hypothetical protein L218DRAFT_1078979 [Marasmius fiardii PR-910]
MMAIDPLIIKRKIAELEPAIHKTRQHLLSMEMELKLYRDMLPSILNLPTEILSLIFEACAESDKDGHVMSLRAVPWALSHTCRRWRSISLAKPSLWRVVRIDSYRHSYPTNPHAMLKTWLSRSQSAPLSCDISVKYSPQTFYDEDEDDLAEIDAELIDLLLEENHRWLDVSFSLADRIALYRHIVTFTKPFPLLRYLQVYVDEDPDFGVWAWAPFGTRAFASAPSLVDASVNVGQGVPVISLPWGQLKRFHCGSSHDEDFFRKLAKLKKLEHLIFPLHNPFFGDQPQMLSFVNLRRLDMFAWSWRPIVEILPFLCLPALQDLLLYCTHGDVNFDIILRLIIDLQERSSCRLKRMTLPLPLLSSPVIFEFAQHFASIEELHLDVNYRGLGDISQVRQALDNLRTRAFLPRLRALYFILYFVSITVDGSHSLFDHIAEAVEDRRDPSLFENRLESVSLDTARKFTEKQNLPLHIPGIQRILDLCLEGLTLLERVDVDNQWLCPIHETARHWDAGTAQEDAARFGGATPSLIVYY